MNDHTAVWDTRRQKMPSRLRKGAMERNGETAASDNGPACALGVSVSHNSDYGCE
jgi:hypothetical protein